MFISRLRFFFRAQDGHFHAVRLEDVVELVIGQQKHLGPGLVVGKLRQGFLKFGREFDERRAPLVVNEPDVAFVQDLGAVGADGFLERLEPFFRSEIHQLCAEDAKLMRLFDYGLAFVTGLAAADMLDEAGELGLDAAERFETRPGEVGRGVAGLIGWGRGVHVAFASELGVGQWHRQ